MENQNNKQVVVTLRNKSNKTRKKERRFGRKEEENLRNKRKQRQKIVSLITNSFPSSIAASLQLLFFPGLLPQNTQILLNFECFISISIFLSLCFFLRKLRNTALMKKYPLCLNPYKCPTSTSTPTTTPHKLGKV